MPYRRGDVVLVYFPNSDLRTVRRRPALIVQDETVPIDHPQRVVACITSRTHRLGPTRLYIEESTPVASEMGLLSDSVIVVDNLATLPDSAIDRAIGHCPIMNEVDARLRLLFRL
jgi:mRNA interferase MazF